ncbi:hypothetical protein H4I95_08735 [Botrytis cinerea]
MFQLNPSKYHGIKKVGLVNPDIDTWMSPFGRAVECTAPSILPTSKSVDDAPFLWRFNLDMTMEKNDEAISPTLADRKIEKTGGFFRLFKERFKDKCGVWCDLFSWDIWTDSEDIESYTPLLGFMTEDFNRDLATLAPPTVKLNFLALSGQLSIKSGEQSSTNIQEPAIKTSPILISGIYNQALPPDFVGALRLRGEILEEPPYLPPTSIDEFNFTGLGVVDGVSVTILGNPAPMTIVVGNTGFEDVPYGRPMAIGQVRRGPCLEMGQLSRVSGGDVGVLDHHLRLGDDLKIICPELHRVQERNLSLRVPVFLKNKKKRARHLQPCLRGSGNGEGNTPYPP